MQATGRMLGDETSAMEARAIPALSRLMQKVRVRHEKRGFYLLESESLICMLDGDTSAMEARAISALSRSLQKATLQATRATHWTARHGSCQ